MYNKFSNYFYVHKISSKILSPSISNTNTICNTNIVIAPKPPSINQNVQKLKVVSSLKPIINAAISSKTNNVCKYNINLCYFQLVESVYLH